MSICGRRGRSAAAKSPSCHCRRRRRPNYAIKMQPSSFPGQSDGLAVADGPCLAIGQLLLSINTCDMSEVSGGRHFRRPLSPWLTAFFEAGIVVAALADGLLCGGDWEVYRNVGWPWAILEKNLFCFLSLKHFVLTGEKDDCKSQL